MKLFQGRMCLNFPLCPSEDCSSVKTVPYDNYYEDSKSRTKQCTKNSKRNARKASTGPLACVGKL